MADFSLLAQPNFAQSALNGYQAGAAVGKQRQLDTALSGVDLERPETLLPLLRADPSTGAALIGASTRLSAEKRDQASRAALGSYIKQVTNTQPGPTAADGTAGPPTTTVGPVPDASAPAPGEIVVSAPRPDPLAEARNAAIDADPDGFLKIQAQIGTMQKADRERVADASDALANVAQQALGMPYAQRKAFIQQNGGDLAQHGVTQAMLAAFDPTDQNLHLEIGKSTGVKFQIEQQAKAEQQAAEQADKDRQFSLAQQREGREASQGAAHIAIDRQSAGISAGHLALDRAKEAREAAKDGAGGGGVAAPANKAAYDALPRGTTYRAPDGSLRVKN